jgi:hypothetical protein
MRCGEVSLENFKAVDLKISRRLSADNYVPEVGIAVRKGFGVAGGIYSYIAGTS